MEGTLIMNISKAKEGDINSIEELIKKFQPLLIKYSSQLNSFDDAKSELTLHFINTIRKIPLYNKDYIEDKYILSYIKTSIRRQYIYLLSIQQNIEKLNIKMINYEESSYYDKSNLIFYDIIKTLNNKEKFILEKKFIDDFTNNEISRELNVSRQNIQMCLSRALYKLKKNIVNIA